MSNPIDRGFLVRLWVLVFLPLLVTCSDAPSAPDGLDPSRAGYFTLVPRFAASAEGDEAAEAAARVFDRVDRFRLVLRRIPSGELAKDTTIGVEPGQESYSFSLPVSLDQPDERFTLELTGLEGQTPLFTATAEVSPTAALSSAPPVDIDLEYSGPGATATSATITPAGTVLSPGTSRTLHAEAKDAAGNVLALVPVFWSAESSAVTVTEEGRVSGAGAGVSRVTATTPTGVTAEAWVYVAAGEVAFVGPSGAVLRAAVGGSTASSLGVSGGRPAWRPDGSGVVASLSGQVVDAATGAQLLPGGAPAFSPDGSKLAVESGGVRVANADGSLATAAFSGATPVWESDGEHVLVGGGSIQRVGADGTGRETVVSGESARWPALPASGGPVAYVADVSGEGALFVLEGGGARRVSPEGMVVRSRPTWSPDGRWLVAALAEGSAQAPRLWIVDPSGEAPPVRLPVDASTAADPAWRPVGPPPSPPAVVISSMDPARPLPGERITLRGGGFDWIIPDNNRVYLPTSDGPVETEVLSVTPGELETRAPADLGAGTLRVTTFTGEGTFAVSPSVGGLQVLAETPWGKGVSGVDVRVLRDGEVVATGTTDESGAVDFENLFTGAYRVEVTAVREGFAAGAPTGDVSVTLDGTTTVALDVTAEIRGLDVDPTELTLPAPDTTVALSALATDVDGDSIPTAAIEWAVGDGAVLGLETSGTEAELTALAPGTTEVTARAAELEAVVGVTVQGAVRGTVKTLGGKGVSGTTLVMTDENSEEVGRATTDEEGAFRLTGLPLGSLTLRVAELRDGFEPVGEATQAVTVAAGEAEPETSVQVRARVQAIQLSVGGDELVFRNPGEIRTVEGTATDVDGDAIADPPLVWESSDPDVVETLPPGGDGAGARADVVEAAAVRLRAVAPGEAEVTVQADGATASVGAAVRAGFSGLVEYRYGEPFAGATLVLFRNGNELGRTESDAEGGFAFGELELGTYRVEIVLEDGFTAQQAALEVTVASGEVPESPVFVVNPEPRRLDVQPAVDTIQQSDTAEASATAFDARDVAIPDADILFESTDPDVVRVVDDGGGAAQAGQQNGQGQQQAAEEAVRQARVVGWGPGSAQVVVTAGELQAAIDYTVQGAIRGAVVDGAGAPFAGATLTLRLDGAAVRDPVTTDDTGAFLFRDLAARDYMLQLELPSGYSVDGPNPMPVTVEPGLGPLEIVVVAKVRSVDLSPAPPFIVHMGQSFSVTATPLNVKGEPVGSVDGVSWASRTPALLDARGSTLTGILSGVTPSSTPGDAHFEVVIDGQAFPFDATVRSFIEGTVVTEDPDTGERSPTSGVVVRLVQDGSELARINTNVLGGYSFTDLTAGSYVVEVEPPAADLVVFPEAPTITLSASNPTGTQDFVITSLFLIGDLVIETPQDLADFAVTELEGVTGDVFIQSNPSNALTDLTGLELLRRVRGDVIVQNNDALNDLTGLDNLETIGGSLVIMNNLGLSSLPNGFPALTSVGQSLMVNANSNLASLGGFNALLSVGGTFSLASNPSLSGFGSFESLATVGGDFDLSSNPALTSIAPFGALTSVGGGLLIFGTGLTQITGFVGLKSVGGTLGLAANDQVTTITGFGALRTVAGSIELTGNAALGSIPSFPALTSVGGRIGLFSNPSLTEINGFGALTSVGEDLLIGTDPAVTTVSGFDALQTVQGDIFLLSNSVAKSLPRFPALGSVGGTLWIAGNHSLAQIAGFGILETVGEDLRLGNNASVTGLPQFPALTFVGGTVSISGNNAPTVTGFNALETIGGSFSVSSGALIELTGFGSLTTIGGDWFLSHNPNLATLSEFPSLQTVGGLLGMLVTGNGLEVTGFNSLQSVGSFLDFQRNDGLVSVDGFNAVKQVRDFVQLNNPALTSFTGFESLETVDRSFSFSDTPVLNTLSTFPSLTTVGGQFSVANTGLTSLTGLQALTTIGGLFLANNSSLVTVDALSGVTSSLGRLEVSNNPALTDITGLNALGDALGADPIITGDFTITNNTSLGDAAATNLLNLLEAKYGGTAVTGTVTISGNN